MAEAQQSTTQPATLQEAAALLHGVLPAQELAEIAAIREQGELLRWQLSHGDFVRDHFKLADPDTLLMKNIGVFGSADEFSHEIIVALWIRLQTKH